MPPPTVRALFGWDTWRWAAPHRDTSWPAVLAGAPGSDDRVPMIAGFQFLLVAIALAAVVGSGLVAVRVGEVINTRSKEKRHHMVRFIILVLVMYVWILILHPLSTWLPFTPDKAFDKGRAKVGRLTSPVLNLLRKVVVPLRLGAITLDLTNIVAIMFVFAVAIPVVETFA